MREVYIRDLNPTRLHKNPIQPKQTLQPKGWFPPLYARYYYQNAPYPSDILAPVNQFNLICFYHMLFLQVSLDEYTGNHHTNTFSLLFLFLTFENGSFPTSRTNFPFINHLRLPFITLFFFALLMPCNDTKLMSSFQTLNRIL